MNNSGIPFSHAYTPLNHHSNFNKKRKEQKFSLILIFNIKNKKNFKNTYEICYRKLTELSIHRPVSKKHLNFLIKKLKNISTNIELNKVMNVIILYSSSTESTFF